MPNKSEHMIQPAIRDGIIIWCKQVEVEEGVRVLYAAESGSPGGGGCGSCRCAVT